MNKSGLVNNKRVVFSKWSGKSYSTFASLNKVVNIAQLSVDISNASLIKKHSLISLINLSVDDNNKDDDALFEKITDPQQYLQILPLVAIFPDISLKQENTINNHNGKPVFCIKQNMGFLFLKHLEK